MPTNGMSMQCPIYVGIKLVHCFPLSVLFHEGDTDNQGKRSKAIENKKCVCVYIYIMH